MALRVLLMVFFAVAPVLRADSVLPAQFGHWTATKSPANATVQAAASRPEAKDIFAESGLDQTETRNYSDGKSAIPITAYWFHDSSGAYEAYTYLLQAKNESPRFLFVGNVVVEVDQSAPISAEDQKQLMQQVAAKADKTPPPPIPNFLPLGNRITGSEKYALGPAAFRAATVSLGREEYGAMANTVGFATGAEAMFARYAGTREEAVLLLIDYPTPQLAGLHWKHLEQVLPPSAKQSGTSIERKGTVLAIVIAPSSEQYAAKLRDNIQYETQVTWNEPSHTITDPPILSVVAKIIIATGVFLLVAIVFGVAFGGVRIITKRLFPGKVFDRPEQMDVLQLGLSGKRIDSRDLY